MTTIFKKYENNICFKFLSFFYERNINITHSIMTKLRTTLCYSISNLKGSLKVLRVFPECHDFPRNSLSFQVFPNFSNFPDFPGFP